MRVLDLFSGIGGFRSGFEQAGHEIVGFVEWDKNARQSYKVIYDTTGEFEGHDIRNVRAESLPQADIWTFGSPCQNISLAGNQEGLRGDQSSLFLEVIRLLRETDSEKMPTYLLMENVKNLLSVNGGRDFARVLIEMDEIGYDVEWNVFNSYDVTPQNRERVYIVGHLRGGRGREIFPFGTNDERPYNARWERNPEGLIIRNGTTIGFDLAEVGDGVDLGYPKSKTRRGRVQHNRTNTLTTSSSLGVVIDSDNGKWIRKLTPLEYWRLQGFTDEQFYKAKKSGVSEQQLYKQAGNSVTVPVVKSIAERM